MSCENSTMEFKSKLEEIMPAKELLFDPTPSFGKYKPFLEHAIAHPAKMNTELLTFLILEFTKPGETILDPMAGTGSTGVVAALHGRNAIQVEIEPKFFEWMEKARENVEKHPSLTPKGWIKNILGDARRLSELLKEADVCITSPPYLKSAEQGAGINRQREGDVRIGCSTINRVVTHPEAIDNTKEYGDINVVITSPPYSECPGSVYKGLGERIEKLFREGKITKEQYEHFKGRRAYFEEGAEPYPKSDMQIANLPHGDISAIITSPPYAETYSSSKAGRAIRTGKTKIHSEKHLARPYTEDLNKENIGNLPLGNVDAVITSPPYAETISKHAGGAGGIARKKEFVCGISLREARQYSENEQNIGNLPLGNIDTVITSQKSSDEEYEALARSLMKNGKPTYLSEMLKVYRQMFKVLKPNGLAIIVIKPFIRNKKVIDLPYHTWLLMEKVGFKLEKLYKLRLKQQSFWRILYYKKFSNIPKISHEYILICKKP